MTNKSGKPDNIPLEECNNEEYVGYLKSRLAQFNNEREEIVKNLKKCCLDVEELQSYRWELRKKNILIQELEKKLYSKDDALTVEKSVNSELESENDNLRIIIAELESKIEYITSITSVKLEEEFVVKGGASHTMSRVSRGPGSAMNEKQSTSTLRVVHLPQAADHLLLKRVRQLENELANEKSRNMEVVRDLRTKVASCEMKHQMVVASYEEEAGKLLAKVDSAESRMLDTTAELLALQASHQKFRTEYHMKLGQLQSQKKGSESEVARLNRQLQQRQEIAQKLKDVDQGIVSISSSGPLVRQSLSVRNAAQRVGGMHESVMKNGNNFSAVHNKNDPNANDFSKQIHNSLPVNVSELPLQEKETAMSWKRKFNVLLRERSATVSNLRAQVKEIRRNFNNFELFINEIKKIAKTLADAFAKSASTPPYIPPPKSNVSVASKNSANRRAGARVSEESSAQQSILHDSHSQLVSVCASLNEALPQLLVDVNNVVMRMNDIPTVKQVLACAKLSNASLASSASYEANISLNEQQQQLNNDGIPSQQLSSLNYSTHHHHHPISDNIYFQQPQQTVDHDYISSHQQKQKQSFPLYNNPPSSNIHQTMNDNFISVNQSNSIFPTNTTNNFITLDKDNITTQMNHNKNINSFEQDLSSRPSTSIHHHTFTANRSENNSNDGTNYHRHNLNNSNVQHAISNSFNTNPDNYQSTTTQQMPLEPPFLSTSAGSPWIKNLGSTTLNPLPTHQQRQQSPAPTSSQPSCSVTVQLTERSVQPQQHPSTSSTFLNHQSSSRVSHLHADQSISGNSTMHHEHHNYLHQSKMGAPSSIQQHQQHTHLIPVSAHTSQNDYTPLQSLSENVRLYGLPNPSLPLMG